MSKQVKDSRLWNKGCSGVIPFATRSQKLALDLMRTVGIKESILVSFREGKVVRTNCLNALSISQELLSEIDEGIISDLEKNGLSVYHVLLSYFMVGKHTEIQCEHEVSIYEKIVSTKSFLCVPKDIFAEAMSFDEDINNDSNRELVIKEYIEHEIFMANQGSLYAYVVNEEDGIGDFFNISVNVYNGNFVRIS